MYQGKFVEIYQEKNVSQFPGRFVRMFQKKFVRTNAKTSTGAKSATCKVTTFLSVNM